MWQKKRGRPPSPALDLRPAFPVIKLAIGLYLPNVGLMLTIIRVVVNSHIFGSIPAFIFFL